MKYEEFRDYLKGTDFNVVENDVLIEVLPRVYKDGLGCVKIAKNTHRRVMLPSAVEEPEQFELIRKALELAETPLEEREEEKKYYLKHKFINDYNGLGYINLRMNEKVILSNQLEVVGVPNGSKTKFTKAEIEELKERFDTDLNDFELIEVED